MLFCHLSSPLPKSISTQVGSQYFATNPTNIPQQKVDVAVLKPPKIDLNNTRLTVCCHISKNDLNKKRLSPFCHLQKLVSNKKKNSAHKTRPWSSGPSPTRKSGPLCSWSAGPGLDLGAQAPAQLGNRAPFFLVCGAWAGPWSSGPSPTRKLDAPFA